MEREKVIREIKTFLSKYSLEKGTTFKEIPEYDLIVVTGDIRLWDLVYDYSFTMKFCDLPRSIKDRIIEVHPEINEEFDEECEEFEINHEEYGFPNRIEFDSEKEYQKLKGEFLYELKESFLKQYDTKYEVGEYVYEDLCNMLKKYGYLTLYYDGSPNCYSGEYEHAVIITI